MLSGAARRRRFRTCSAAADLNPLYAETYYLLGVALEQTQQYREAAAAYERTISLNPNDEESRQRLAEVRSRL